MMPNDSAHHAFGNITTNRASPKDTAISYNCTQCVLIFKTRIYLYEHLHQVHGLSVDCALRDSGLKSVPQIRSKLDNSLKLGKSKPDISLKLGKSKTDISLKLGKSKTENSVKKSDFAFNCKKCNFKSGNWSIYCEHKQQCSGSPNYENHTAEQSVMINKPKSSSGAKETNLEKAKHNTSTDVKNYSKSPQTITKYFAASGTMKSDYESNKRNTQTLRLEESSSSSSGVFQVTASSIDLAQASISSSKSLLCDLDRISDPTSANPVELFKEVPPKYSCKRIAKEIVESNPSKKPKLESEASVEKLKTSAANLSFEVSDDEEKMDPVSNTLNTIKEYFCKHCQYNTADLMHLVSHYEDNHPYIKCNSYYIEEKNDQTAMFRCLECPVEFSREAHLHSHYSEDHPDAPEIVSLKFADLVYRCFVCPFTSKILQSLKEHYKEKHPSQKVENSLWYSKYSSPRHNSYAIHRGDSEENKSPEKLESERTTTTREGEVMSSAPKSHDGTMYYCGRCPFSHKSVVVLHVHYKKCHPEEPITLDKIKQLVSALHFRASEKKPDTEQDKSPSIKIEENWASPVSDSEEEDVSFNHNLQDITLATGLDIAASSPVEKMFFCCRCSFSHSNIKSVVSHHNAKHGITTTIGEILHHTAEVESKNINVHSSESSVYAHPLDLYYCKICNYGNPTLLGIMGHQNKLHSITEGKESVLEHTAMIRDQIEKSKSHPIDYILPSGLPIPLVNATDTALVFCHLCNYRHKNFHVLLGHYVKSHKGFRSTPQQIAEYSSMVSERLKTANPKISCQGNKKVTDTDVQKKYKIKTTILKAVPVSQRQAKLKCIRCSYDTNHLYCMRKHFQKHHKNTLSLSEIVQICGAEATFQPGYHCDACSFWHSNPIMVRRHCMDRHARSLSDRKLNSSMYLSPSVCDPQNGGNAFNRNITEAKKDSSTVQDTDDDDDDNGDVKEDFDSYQVPLEFDNLNVSTKGAKQYSCSYCPAKFEEHGGLLIHLGMKHRDEIDDKMPQQEMAERSPAFKCHNCSYMNNIKQGVVSHSVMKHPNKALKLCSIYVEREHLKNVQIKVKNGMWKFCGFICKDCSQVYPSKEKLKLHRETHKWPLVQNKDEEIWCKLCGLYCSSAKEHTDHLRVCHKNSTNSSSIFPCALCPNAFITKVRLGIHYTKKHGKEAFFKHYVPLYNQPTMEKKATVAQPTLLRKSEMILMYKCPSCRYANSSFHGTLTHCQMRHPKIVVRAGKLKTAQLESANMVGCLSEKAKNFGGYRCRKCPLVYGALNKLKKHCEVDHNPNVEASSDYNAVSLAPESAGAGQKLVSKFRHFFKCSLCSYSTSILKQLGNHYMQRHGKSSYIKFYSPLFHQTKKTKIPFKHEEMGQVKLPLDQVENRVKTTVPQQVYKCNACSYGSQYRRYLIAHFKNRHKYDSQAVYKHMEKYKNSKATLPSGQFDCKKCHNVVFESKGRLLAHYRTFHTSEMQIDFTIIAQRTDRTTGVFKCNYCKKKIFGIKNICKHLDKHRERWLKKEEKSESKDFEEETGLNVTGKEMAISPASASMTLDPGVPEVSEEESSDSGIHTCLRCKRTFRSLKGLRSHQRSHAALAALDNATALDFQERVEKYIMYRTGTLRPYMCTLCSYRTSVISLGKSHIMKKHPYVWKSEVFQYMDNTQRGDEASPNCMDDMNADDDEPENSYLEPPDVQRQLKHYSVIARIDHESKIHSDSRILPCEMCNFNCQHYSAMRRHYLKRHGKKLIRCKDCDFFSCFKQNLDLHEQMGHSTLQSEPTHQKNLCCPFCLYQSKNKNNMIDHIVLHREERVMPIEVRRSKLSRYLQGIVFRCYKCTFTCGSAERLHLHMAKHSDLKPFKCRLCYFDCTQLRDLEAHLCDKHQVVRNHQLVGQVCLDQLAARANINSQDDEDYEEMLNNPENDEQTTKNQNTNENEDKTEDAEENRSNPGSSRISIAGKSWNERFEDHTKYMRGHYDYQAQLNVTEDASDNPKIHNVPGQCLNESFKEEMDDTDDEHKAQIKAAEDESESLPLCTDEGRGESRDMETNAEREGQNVDDSMADVALDSNDDSKTKLDVQNPIHEKRSDGSKNDSSPPCSVEPTISQVVHQDQHKMNSTEKSAYGEMPILEKYFKEQCLVFAQSGETVEKSPLSVKEDRHKENSEVLTSLLLEAQNSPPVLQDMVSAVHSPAAAVLFPCDLCGRSLANTSDLERHMMRHGM